MNSANNYVFYFSILLQICGLFLFFMGFLPMNPMDQYKGDDSKLACQRYSKDKENTASFNGDYGQRLKRKKLVLMVVDALREDFTFKGNHLPYLQRLIRENKTLSFLAKGHPPTVTLPRIKAMVTGKISGFIDVVLNFASAELSEDNVISKLYNSGKVINFFGDDTWLKLFPNCFLRKDGTTSFVVSDYKEVDDNVTRHLPNELSRSDWDVLILHFLGLDHIGHSAGPKSPLVAPKLLEMDQIIKGIVEKLIKRDSTSSEESLFILTSDHGMNDAGSHGGASSSEVLTPLVFISQNLILGHGDHFTRKLVSQVDLAPSVAAFFDLEIPKNSLGTIITDLLKHLPPEAQKEKMRENICQLSKQSELLSFPDYCNANSSDLKMESIDYLTAVLKDLSRHLQKQSVEYQTDKMVFGLILQALSLLPALWTLRKLTYTVLDILFGIFVLLHSLFITSTSFIEEEHQFWYFTVTTCFFILALNECTVLAKQLSKKAKDTRLWSLFHCLEPAALYGVILIAFRIVRGWNQTGVKWLDQTDISSLLFENVSRRHIPPLIMVSVLLIYFACFMKTSMFYKALNAFALLFVLINKAIAALGSTFWPFSSNGVTEARIVFAICIIVISKNAISSCIDTWSSNCIDTWTKWNGVVRKSTVRSSSLYVDDSIVVNDPKDQQDSVVRRSSKPPVAETGYKKTLKCSKEEFFYAFLLFYIILLRPHNIAWMVLTVVIERSLNFVRNQRISNRSRDVSTTVLYYCLGKAFFHAQGHSNSLASVDVSAAFVGMDHYSPLLSGFMTAMATFGSHMFWFLSLNMYSSQNWELSLKDKWTIRSIYNAIMTSEGLVICLVTYLNRYHLFIWTVFAPKFLFLATFRLFMATVLFIF